MCRTKRKDKIQKNSEGAANLRDDAAADIALGARRPGGRGHAPQHTRGVAGAVVRVRGQHAAVARGAARGHHCCAGAAGGQGEQRAQQRQRRRRGHGPVVAERKQKDKGERNKTITRKKKEEKQV